MDLLHKIAWEFPNKSVCAWLVFVLYGAQSTSYQLFQKVIQIRVHKVEKFAQVKQVALSVICAIVSFDAFKLGVRVNGNSWPIKYPNQNLC